MYYYFPDCYSCANDAWMTLSLLQYLRVQISQIFPICSPVKFAGGDCWPRGTTLVGSPSLLSPGSSGEQPMDVSTVEQMDTSSSNTTEASAPLPIRHPSGINAGPYKKQAYPMNSKRPEHLRMNLWRSACLRTLGLFQFHLFVSFYDILSDTFFSLFWKTDTFSADHQLFQPRLLLFGVQSPPDAWPPQLTIVDIHSARGRCERSAYHLLISCVIPADEWTEVVTVYSTGIIIWCTGAFLSSSLDNDTCSVYDYLPLLQREFGHKGRAFISPSTYQATLVCVTISLWWKLEVYTVGRSIYWRTMNKAFLNICGKQSHCLCHWSMWSGVGGARFTEKQL